MKRSIPFVSTSVPQDLALGVALIPIWYVLGIRFCAFHLLSVLVFIKSIRAKRSSGGRFSLPLEPFLLLVFVLLYGFSLLLNAPGIPFSRVLASLNNLSFWIMGLFLLLAIENSMDKAGLSILLRSFRMICVVTALFVLFSLAFWIFSHRYPNSESLLLRLVPEKYVDLIQSQAPLLHASLNLGFIREDKLFGREVPRPTGFDVYSNSLGVTLIFLLLMTLAYQKTQNKTRGSAFFIILTGVALLLSLSRIAWIALLAAGIFILLDWKKFLNLKVLAGLAAAILVFLILVPPQELLRLTSQFRKGSTITRNELYRETLTRALHRPILGHGFKPRVEEFPLPIGSHSTFIGVVYRTGFLGFVVFCGFFTAVLRKWRRVRFALPAPDGPDWLWVFLGMAFLSGLVWMLAEDLDAPPVASFLYFVIIGLALSLERIRRVEPER